jgi:hypothetical protein
MMMHITCPSGHSSTADDYCDQCGARIAPAVPDTTAPYEVVAPELERCPRCGTTPIDDDTFCESCGYRFDSSETTLLQWVVEISADRQQFERFAPEDVEFPSDDAQRTVQLSESNISIGRGNNSSIVCDDPAVSHSHATLVRQKSGAYAIHDLASTNGTRINDNPTPIPADTPVPISDGDRARIGAWTTLTFRAAPIQDAV